MMWLANIALWFAESKIGRAIAAVAAIALAVGIAILKVFNAGKASERGRQDKQSLDNFRERARIENEVDSLSPDDVQRRLDRWVRPSDGR